MEQKFTQKPYTWLADIPAAVLTHIISAVTYGGCTYGNGLEDIVMEAIEVVPDLFEDKE